MEPTEYVYSFDGGPFRYFDDFLDYEEGLTPGTEISRGIVIRPNYHNFCTVSDIVEMMSERAYDIGGEFAEDYPEGVGSAAMDEMDQFLRAWQTKYCVPTFFTVDTVEPYILTAEDLE
jgi:hypothetical protein